MKKKNENSNEIKMEIEPNTSNDLMASGSTNYSNNTHFSMESNNINVSNKSLFCPTQNKINNEYIQSQNQNQLTIISQRDNSTYESNTLSYEEEDKNNKKIFDYNFESGNEFVLFAGEYLDEIYTNLLYDDEELKYKPKLGYMNSQIDINEQMRAILIDWLIEVHYRFRLKSETLFQTVWIIDTYLTFEQIQRAEMENNILKILNFNIVSPTPNDFYNIIAKAFNFDKKQFYLGRYFLEAALIDYQMLRYSSSVIAVSCAYIVMKFFGINNYKILYNSDVVREKCPQKAIKEAAREICYLVKNLSQSTLKAVKDKYSLSQFLNVAQYCEQK